MHTITPSASRPMTEIWRTTLIRFCGFRKELFGEKTREEHAHPEEDEDDQVLAQERAQSLPGEEPARRSGRLRSSFAPASGRRGDERRRLQDLLLRHLGAAELRR